MILRRNGIILAKKEYGLDLAIWFLTSQGIIRIKAKSILKPKAKLRSVAETFDLVSFELIQGKSQFILIGGKLLKRPMFLRKSLKKSLFLKALGEITLLLVKDHETKNIFLLWLNCLKTLKNLKNKDLMAFFAFNLTHVLAIEGFLHLKEGGEMLKDLYSLPYSALLEKSYSEKAYKKMIIRLKNSLAVDNEKLRLVNLFLKTF